MTEASPEAPPTSQTIPPQRETTPTAKLDPETLAIRARPAAAIRFKRNVIVALAAAGTGGLTIIAWSALGHHPHIRIAQSDDLSQPATQRSTALAELPSTYGAVPKLGPPLPGDLGKPILEHQASTPTAVVTEQERAAEAARMQQADEARSARESGLLVRATSSAAASTAAPPADAAASSPAAPTRNASLDPVTDPNAQQHKLNFVGATHADDPINPHSLTAAASPYLLSAGSVIAASLITGLRSDLPGIVSAQVTANVYDSPTGRVLLVPQGARLIGKYDSVVAFGQKRALLVWQRIILPDGSSISLDNMPATDPSGYAGLEDKVDFHTWQLLKGVAISTLLGIGADLQFSGNGGLVEAIRQSGQQSVSRAGDELTAKALDVQPTLTIRPGAPVRLIVDRDLILAPTGAR
jgi:type IV secretion system protein VirB10